MKKGSLVRMRTESRFTYQQLVKAYYLRTILPIHGEIYTLSQDPVDGPCKCGDPNCPNGDLIKLEECPPACEFSKSMFEEVQTPEEVEITTLLDPPSEK